MLNPDFKSRIGTPEILQRLMGYMQTMPDFTSAARWKSRNRRARDQPPCRSLALDGFGDGEGGDTSA